MSTTPDPSMPVGATPEMQRRDAAIDVVWAERGYPTSAKQAGRCGWIAKERDAEAALAALQKELGECSGGYQTLEREVAALQARLEAAEKALVSLREANNPLTALSIHFLVAAGFVTQEKADEAFRLACDLAAREKRIGEPPSATQRDALRFGADVAETLLKIGRAIGFGRAQQILGEQWEADYDCAPRGRMGVTVKDATSKGPAA